MAPKIHGTSVSIPFRAVLMCARHIGLELDIQEVDLIKGEHLRENFIKVNPQHTVPLLEDNGFYLADSHAINGYLVAKYGKKNDPLYPSDDIERKATIDHRLHFDSSIIAAAGMLISKPLVLEDTKPTEATLNRLKEAFATLNKLLEIQNTPYIVGHELSIADFSIVSSVTGWGYFLKTWPQDFPHVKAYTDRLTTKPFYEANVEGLKLLHNLIEFKLKSL